MSSHLAPMRALPNSAQWLRVSEKSIQKKTAIVSNKDQAPFYPSVFSLTLRSSWNRCSWYKHYILHPVSPQKTTASKCHFLAEESPKSWPRRDGIGPFMERWRGASFFHRWLGMNHPRKWWVFVVRSWSYKVLWAIYIFVETKRVPPKIATVRISSKTLDFWRYPLIF